MGRVLGVAFTLLFGVGALYLSGRTFSDTWRFVHRSRTAPGTMAGLQHVVSDTSDGIVEGDFPVFRFQTPDGQTHSFRGRFSSALSPKFGAAVEVLYDPADPSQALLNSFFNLWTPTLALGGLGLICIGVVFAVVAPARATRALAAPLRPLARVATRAATLEVLGPGSSPVGSRRRAWSDGLGCAVGGLVPVGLGLLWVGWFLYGERNGAGLAIGVVVLLAGLAWVNTGLQMLPWPVNLAVGLVLVGIGAGWLWSTERFLASAARTEGTVTDFAALQEASPVIRFSPGRGNEEVAFTVWAPFHRKLVHGDRVAVVYDPEHPARAALDSFATLWLDAVALTLFGAALAASAVYIRWAMARQRALAAAPR